MKNIAILLTGIPRLVYPCIDAIKHIAKNNKVYLFVWNWRTEDSVELSKNSWTGKCHGNNVDLNFDVKMFDLPEIEHGCFESGSWKELVPLFEEQRDESKEVKEIFELSAQFWQPYSPLGIYGMWYAVMKANELRENYEKKHNMIFDCVMRARFELNVMDNNPWRSDKDFVIEDFDMNKLWKSCSNLDIKYGMNDCLAFSSSSNMSHYCRMYENINKCILIEKSLSPEAIEFHHNKDHYEMLPQYIFLGR